MFATSGSLRKQDPASDFAFEEVREYAPYAVVRTEGQGKSRCPRHISGDLWGVGDWQQCSFLVSGRSPDRTSQSLAWAAFSRDLFGGLSVEPLWVSSAREFGCNMTWVGDRSLCSCSRIHEA